MKSKNRKRPMSRKRKVSRRKIKIQRGGIKLMKNDKGVRDFILEPDRIVWRYGVASAIRSFVGRKVDPGQILYRDIRSVSNLRTETYAPYEGAEVLEWKEFDITTSTKNYKLDNLYIPKRGERRASNEEVEDFYKNLKEIIKPPRYADVVPISYEAALALPTYSATGGRKRRCKKSRKSQKRNRRKRIKRRLKSRKS